MRSTLTALGVCLIAILIVIWSCTLSMGFWVELRNTENHKVYYNLWWIDSPYPDGPMPIMGGELKPGAMRDSLTDWYKPGLYSISFFDSHINYDYKDIFIIPADDHETEYIGVVLTPNQTMIVRLEMP